MLRLALAYIADVIRNPKNTKKQAGAEVVEESQKIEELTPIEVDMAHEWLLG